MLIEQTIEFELRVLRPLVIHIFLKLVIFMTKQKAPRQNHRLKYYLTLSILQKARYRASFDPGQVTKFNPKMLNFKRVLDLTCSKVRHFFQLIFKSQKFCSFKWLWKRAKCNPNGIKRAFFSKKLQKIAQRQGASPSGPRL